MIKIKNLNFAYKKDILYKNLSINFEAGHIYGLLGRNGSGKTTLFGLISGNLFAKSGDISTLGYNPKQRNASMLSDIFYLSEYSNLPNISAKEYIKTYSLYYPKFSLSEFDDYMKIFQVQTVKKLTKLSQGQAKKFALSFGLACNCSLNLLDEPTNGLDIPSKTIFRQVIAKLKSNHKTFIISTHHIKDIDNIIDRISLVDDADIVLHSSMAALGQSLYMYQSDKIDGNELYVEQGNAGKYNIINTSSKEKGFLDLELLFSAMLSSPKTMNNILSHLSIQGALK